MALKWHSRTGWGQVGEVAGLELYVWCTHSSGMYSADCKPLINRHTFAADTMAEAKSAAVSLLRERLQELIKELDQ